MARPSPLPFITLGVLTSLACAARGTPLAQPVGPGVMDTVSTARAAVVVPDTGAGAVREYRGSFSSGFEISWFEPCDAPPGDHLWWVTLSEEARVERDSLLRLMKVRPTKGLAVRWRATVSPKMPMGAGQMGRGSRYMLVTRILSLRALDAEGGGACGRPSASGA